jgi:hypothetical protein
MNAAALKRLAWAKSAVAGVALAALCTSTTFCSDLAVETLNPSRIEAYLLKNIPPVFSATDTAESRTLPLLKKSFVNFTIIGSLSNRAAGYVISYLNTFVNVTQVGFRRNDESAEVLFVVDKDWSMHIDQYRGDVTRIVREVNYDELANLVTPGALCQSFVYAKDGRVIDHAIVFVSSPPRNYEFDGCLYRMVLQIFGFKPGETPDRMLSADEPGERLLDVAALTILYSLDESDRTVAKLRGAVHAVLEKSYQDRKR